MNIYILVMHIKHNLFHHVLILMFDGFRVVKMKISHGISVSLCGL